MYDTIFLLYEYSKLYQKELKNKMKKDFKNNSIEYYLLSFLEMKKNMVKSQNILLIIYLKIKIMKKIYMNIFK